MVFRWHIEQKLRKTEIHVGYTIPIVAGTLLLVGSFFFGFTFYDLPNLNWVLVPSAATMVGGFVLDTANQAKSARALREASTTILDIAKEIEKVEEKILGMKGNSNTSWSNSLYDRVADLERQVKIFKDRQNAINAHMF